MLELFREAVDGSAAPLGSEPPAGGSRVLDLMVKGARHRGRHVFAGATLREPRERGMLGALPNNTLQQTGLRPAAERRCWTD